MAMVYRYGQMVRDMKVIGDTIKHAGRENFGMSTVTSSKESGKTIKLMVMVSMYI